MKAFFKRVKKHKAGGERENVNRLIEALKKNTDSPVFIHVDRDSGTTRHTKSGFDFSLTYKGQTVFVEAKNAGGKLSDFQKLTQRQIETAGGRFVVCVFAPDSEGKPAFTLSMSSAERRIMAAHPAPFFA